MRSRKTIVALLAAIAASICGLAVAEPGMATWSDQALIEEAKLRAVNGRIESDATPRPEFDYRNLKLVRSGQQPAIVCGEVKGRNSTDWSQFDFNIAREEINVEPHSALNDATVNWFSTQCQAAVQRVLRQEEVRRIPMGQQRGTVDEIRICDASAALAEARYERARFSLFHGMACG